MRALVIDDSRSIRRIIVNIMKGLGYDTIEASNGLEGLAQLEAHGPQDIVLVDWNMPEMNGLEFIKAARAIPANCDMPIMMVTTETEMENISQAFLAGVNEYVMKPFDKDMILEKLLLLGIGA
ncbi:MAG: response regulator [Pirellula sp.]|jgi:two-component system chemotaxis response regulator CheY